MPTLDPTSWGPAVVGPLRADQRKGPSMLLVRIEATDDRGKVLTRGFVEVTREFFEDQADYAYGATARQMKAVAEMAWPS